MEEKLNPNSKNKRNIINIGTSLMVVVLMGLSFAVIAALTISSAKNNLDLSQKQADHTRDYYEACTEAFETIDETGWVDQEFTIQMTESQVLSVAVSDGSITKWRVENPSDWSTDDSLPVHIED